MRVGWLVHTPAYIGGAELTQAEFKAAAPEGVEVVDMPPGGVQPGCDRYVAQNIPYHALDDFKLIRGAPLTKYVHDVWPFTQPGVREWVLENASLVFCSVLHRRRFPHPYEGRTAVIPPALDLARYKPPRQARRHREGTCAISQWRAPSKGGHLIEEWAEEHGPVDVYGPGDFPPLAGCRYRGPVEQRDIPQTLWRYERFVTLPAELEPFSRVAMEAHAAGCEVVTNRLVGAREYFDNTEAVETAAQDFWDFVLDQGATNG